MKLNDLKKEYEFVCNEYIQKFCSKQDIEFDGWISDKVGTIAVFCDQYFFDFSDIVHDVNSKQPKGLIMAWQDESVEAEQTINYYSYTLGLRYSDLEIKKGAQ